MQTSKPQGAYIPRNRPVGVFPWTLLGMMAIWFHGHVKQVTGIASLQKDPFCLLLSQKQITQLSITSFFRSVRRFMIFMLFMHTLHSLGLISTFKPSSRKRVLHTVSVARRILLSSFLLCTRHNYSYPSILLKWEHHQPNWFKVSAVLQRQSHSWVTKS